MRALLTAVLSLALVTGLAAQQRESVELTVYNQGLGLVKDVRVLSLEEGRQAAIHRCRGADRPHIGAHRRAIGPKLG